MHHKKLKLENHRQKGSIFTEVSSLNWLFKLAFTNFFY